MPNNHIAVTTIYMITNLTRCQSHFDQINLFRPKVSPHTSSKAGRNIHNANIQKTNNKALNTCLAQLQIYIKFLLKMPLAHRPSQQLTSHLQQPQLSVVLASVQLFQPPL